MVISGRLDDEVLGQGGGMPMVAVTDTAVNFLPLEGLPPPPPPSPWTPRR